MNETPEEKIMNNVETPEKNRKWTDDVVVPVPLTKFLKMKSKIVKLEHEIKEQEHKRYEYMRQAMDAEDRFKAIKADYEKLLGISKEEKSE